MTFYRSQSRSKTVCRRLMISTKKHRQTSGLKPTSLNYPLFFHLVHYVYVDYIFNKYNFYDLQFITGMQVMSNNSEQALWCSQQTQSTQDWSNSIKIIEMKFPHSLQDLKELSLNRLGQTNSVLCQGKTYFVERRINNNI